jgi:hypothetical protein
MVKNESGENAILKLIAIGKMKKVEILISKTMIKVFFILSSLYTYMILLILGSKEIPL